MIVNANSLMKYDYYNTFTVTQPFCDYDSEGENDSVESTIPRDALEQKNKKLILQSVNKVTTKKSVRFIDAIENFQYTELEMTEEEKCNAFYTIHELQTMKKHAKLYAKFVRTIDSITIHELLNGMEYNDFDNDETNDDTGIICLRGLEKYIKCDHTPSISSSKRRRMIVQKVLFEQRMQKYPETNNNRDDDSSDSEDHYDDDVKYSYDEKISKVSMSISNICRDFAYQVAQKSYCIPAFTL